MLDTQMFYTVVSISSHTAYSNMLDIAMNRLTTETFSTGPMEKQTAFNNFVMPYYSIITIQFECQNMEVGEGYLFLLQRPLH